MSSLATNSASLKMSIATARSLTTTNASTANGRSLSSNATAPAAPLTSAARTYGAKPPRRDSTLRDPCRAVQLDRFAVAAVGAEHDVRVEHGHEAVEIALAGGGEVGVDDCPLADHVGVRRRRRVAHAAPGAACELAGRLRRAVDHRRDLVEWHREHVVQHEREPFGRAERVEHDLQRDPDGVRQQRLVLGVGPGHRRADERLRNEGVQRLLAARPARAEHVQADPRDDRRQPRVEAVDLRRVGAPQPQPGLLHGVVGLAQRAEDPVGDRAQPGPLAVERVGEIEFVHRCHIVGVAGVMPMRPRESQPM